MSSSDLPADLQDQIQRLVEQEVDARLGKFSDALVALQKKMDSGVGGGQEDRATLVVFSGEMDTLFAACTIASGAAAMGMEVSLFFTFWGLNAIRVKKSFQGKSLVEKLMACMMPGGPASVPTSRMNMAGAGPMFLKYRMGKKNVEDLPSMVALVRELGIRIVACETSMKVMGVNREELIEGIEFGGVATYLEDASKSRITLFV